MSVEIDQVGCPSDANEETKATYHGVSHLSNGDDRLTSSGNDASPKAATKVYRRRWLMLFIFVLVFTTNAFQWIQFSIINNLIMK